MNKRKHRHSWGKPVSTYNGKKVHETIYLCKCGGYKQVKIFKHQQEGQG